MSASSTTSSTQYSPVYKLTPDNHVDELKTRFQAMNQNIRISLIGDRASPQPQATSGDGIQQSIGSDTERESDTGVQHVRSTASSISGVHSDSSSVHSPKTKRNTHSRDRAKWHVEQHETDF